MIARVTPIKKAQAISLHNLWLRSNNGVSYLDFRRSVICMIGGDGIMVKWCNMWIGIEEDGYAHS
jgi:Holliday junction resolvase-like predicted endonuclease